MNINAFTDSDTHSHFPLVARHPWLVIPGAIIAEAATLATDAASATDKLDAWVKLGTHCGSFLVVWVGLFLTLPKAMRTWRAMCHCWRRKKGKKP